MAAQENSISFWQPSQGFLDTLKGAFGGPGTNPPHLVLPIGTGRTKPFRTFALGKPQEHVDINKVLQIVKFEWTGERTLRMFSIDVELTFNV